ncbi:MAG TPA: aminotransferase class III-fold pyridoxal phosphate-dependent enzyme [Chloroflexota bacterium]|jgi:4-aminobutyrate aminotransferase|nr:aminotransferase class III-fold pyridoxal phosphate-dependent enzyme [Chloroflexota bacterium]
MPTHETAGPARELLSPVWARYTDIVAEYASGCYIYAENGDRYLDFSSGIGVTSTGHCHPRVVAAAQEQVARLIHGQANIVYQKPMLRLAEQLADVVPAGLDRFFFSNSGAEAIEAAVKLARYATGRSAIITFEGGFHGRTIGTLSLTSSKAKYKAHMGPYMAGVSTAPYPYCYRCQARTPNSRALAGAPIHDGPRQQDGCCQAGVPALHRLLATQVYPEDVAAVLVEPVLGEGGYVVPPPRFLRDLRQFCDQFGMVLIADEVQTGFGRTGSMFAVEQCGVTPDIMVMAKGLASGFPLSGIAARPALMDRWAPGTHGGTFGGNAVACAAACATIDVLRDEDLPGNARRQGEMLLAGLRILQERYPFMGDVRGLGLMVAVEMTAPDGAPDAARAGAVLRACLERGLILLSCGAWDQVVRFIPPLIVTTEQIEDALRIVADALDAVSAVA